MVMRRRTIAAIATDMLPTAVALKSINAFAVQRLERPQAPTPLD